MVSPSSLLLLLSTVSFFDIIIVLIVAIAVVDFGTTITCVVLVHAVAIAIVESGGFLELGGALEVPELNPASESSRWMSGKNDFDSTSSRRTSSRNPAELSPILREPNLSDNTY